VISNNSLPKDLVDALHEKDERIALLERIIRERVPELAHIQSLSTSAIGAVLAAATEKNGSSPNFSALLRHTSTASAASGASAAASASGASTTAAPDALAQQALATSPVVNRSQLAAIDPGNYERLSPDLIAFVEGKLSEVELGHGAGVQSSVVSYITKQLGVNEPDADGDGVEMPAAAWPPYELAVQVVEVFVQNNSLWPVFRKTDLMHE
jgi:hypothetical protein